MSQRMEIAEEDKEEALKERMEDSAQQQSESCKHNHDLDSLPPPPHQIPLPHECLITPSTTAVFTPNGFKITIQARWSGSREGGRIQSHQRGGGRQIEPRILTLRGGGGEEHTALIGSEGANMVT